MCEVMGDEEDCVALIKRLFNDDEDDFYLEFLAEGAANVIYRIYCYHSDARPHDRHCVLRMRKNISSTIPCKDAFEQYQQKIIPLFDTHPELLIKQTLCKVPPHSIIALNGRLHAMDYGINVSRQRDSDRRYVAHPLHEEEPHGIIMESLDRQNQRLVEFKPKWLIQSPSAPKGAKRCRTCALHAMRRSKEKGDVRGYLGFCPLDLMSHDIGVLERTLWYIWPEENTLTQFVEDFMKDVQYALRFLRKLQHDHNNVGMQDFCAPEGKDFSVAMALRDCSVFVRTIRSSTEIDVVKFGDLDLKQATESKLQKWSETERRLIEEGWYTGEKGPDLDCVLSRPKYLYTHYYPL